jgi:hypothetical protein
MQPNDIAIQILHSRSVDDTLIFFGGWASQARFIVTVTTLSLREAQWNFTPKPPENDTNSLSLTQTEFKKGV